MELGVRGRELIKSFETFRSRAYLPTPDDVPTIGWGHTRNVKMGDTCTPEQAEKWLAEDVSNAVSVVNSLPVKLTQSMFDAIVSLIFNVGAGAIDRDSTIGTALRRIGSRNPTTMGVGAPDYYAACSGFFLWRKQKKKDLLGLARRRAKEMSLFLEDGLP